MVAAASTTLLVLGFWDGRNVGGGGGSARESVAVPTTAAPIAVRAFPNSAARKKK